jgi:predicted TIM-barrel fold metal-dependent hydrolase
LVHGGYPWIEEAAFIVSVLPNVYMDISLQNPFAGHGVERIISQVFEFAPFDKVMYGSDAFTVPEMNWMGVHLFRECFESVLRGWVKADYMDVDTALAIGEMVMYRNFENVYRQRI